MLSFQSPLGNNQNQRHNNKNGDQPQNTKFNGNNKFGINQQSSFGPNFSNKNVFQKKKPKNKEPGTDSTKVSKSLNGSNQLPNSRQSTNLGLLKEDLDFDHIIGGFDTNYNLFQNFNQNQRPVPKFLIYQSPVLKAGPIRQDEWDRSNQQKMHQLEQNTNDVSTLYEDFQKMRDKERKVMEDKGLVDKEDTRKTLEDAISFQGSCLEMCPVYERIRRSIENDVRKYEKDPNGKISKDKAIKAFSRPAAGQPPPLPSDVRPPQVLFRTLAYIIDHILDELPEAQSFIWDRTRSIRQDFTYQNYFGPEAMDCNERIVRIHILTLHTMAKTRSEFSQQQELEQMNKALKTLSEMYAEYKSRGIEAPNEAEFRAYYLISQLRDPELDREIQSLSPSVLQDERVQLALNLRNLVQTNIIERGFQSTEDVLNLYKNFFQNYSSGQIPILMSYLLEIHLNEIRFYAVKSLKRSVHAKSKPYPSDYMIQLLSFNDFNDLSSFADYYGIKLTKENGNVFVDILSLNHASHLIPDQKPLRQAFYDKHDFKVKSYQDLIGSGVINVQALDINIEQESLNGSSATAGLQLDGAEQPSQQQQYPSEKAQNFSFLFPQNINGPKLDKKGDESKAEELKNLEKETMLKKKLEEERAKKELDRIEAERKEVERKQELERQRALKLEKEKLQKEEENKRKSEFIQSLSKNLTHSIIKTTVQQEVNDIISPIIEAQKAKKLMKASILNSFSEGLFAAFIDELVYIESLEILAHNFRKTKLRKMIVKKVVKLAKESQEKNEVKKRKREEFLEASKNFGIPKAVLKRKKLNQVHGPVKTLERESDKIDLAPLNFHNLIENLKSSTFDKYEALVFFQDLNSTRSLFLRKKLSIENSLENVIKQKMVDFKITGTDQINPAKFNNVNLLIFNCDGIEKVREQKLLLKELINGISLNSNFKFEVLIIFWEVKATIKLTKQDILRELNFKTNDVILGVDVLKIDSSLKIDSLQHKLNELGTRFGLTARGEYNLRYTATNKLQNTEQNKKDKKNNTLKVFQDDDNDVSSNKFYKHLQKHIEASPKRGSIPKLLSNSSKLLDVEKKSKPKIEVYSTPRPKSSELLQTPSFYNDSTGSSISNLSNITFANQSASTPLIISKPSYAQVVKNSLKEEETKKDEEEKNVPKSILELRKLAASVRERHGKKS